MYIFSPLSPSVVGISFFSEIEWIPIWVLYNTFSLFTCTVSFTKRVVAGNGYIRRRVVVVFREAEESSKKDSSSDLWVISLWIPKPSWWWTSQQQQQQQQSLCKFTEIRLVFSFYFFVSHLVSVSLMSFKLNLDWGKSHILALRVELFLNSNLRSLINE